MGLKQPAVLRVPQFLKYVRSLECACFNRGGSGVAWMDCGNTPVEAAHVRTGTDGGTSMKPSDRYALPLCANHHRHQHHIGEGPFEKFYGISMRSIADGLWAQWLKTDTGRRWALKTGYVAARDRNAGSNAPPGNTSDAD